MAVRSQLGSVAKSTIYKKTQHVLVCGLGVVGSLGLPKFYRPDKKRLNDYKAQSEVGQTTFRRLPQFKSSEKINDIACGYGFTVVAAEADDSSHSAFGFGLNTHSQIGFQCSKPGHPLEIVAEPAAIWLPSNQTIKAVSCGRSHTLLLNKLGEIFSLGNNAMGQCGRPIIEKEQYFASKYVHKITDLPTNIKQIECGQDHSLFLTEDGSVYSCGWGADGQTGLGHFNNEHKPTRVKGDIEGVKVIKVSSCADTVLALDDHGNVFGWGNSEYSQFNNFTDDDSEQYALPRHLELTEVPGKVVDVAAGGTICAVLNDKGQVYVWGFGIIGKGPDVEIAKYPTLIPESLFGRNVYNPDSRVEKIFAGLSQLAAITNKGDLYSWGRNRGLSLGFAHGRPQYFPMMVNMNMFSVKKVSLGVDHSCAIGESIG